MNISSKIGKQHVLEVTSLLRRYLENPAIELQDNCVADETAKYIINNYPNFKSIISKYESSNPDLQPDLVLIYEEYNLEVNLYKVKNGSKIQPKNLGVKSFLEKYFQSPEMQKSFNYFFADRHTKFLYEILGSNEQTSYTLSNKLKKDVSNKFPRFNDHINIHRRNFLYDLREFLFTLIEKAQGNINEVLKTGFKVLSLQDSINIISHYNKENKCSRVELWQLYLDPSHECTIFRKGNDSLGIRIGTSAITLRFKFESSPASSIKIATSFEKFDTPLEQNKINLLSLNEFNSRIKINSLTSKNDPNALGKCNEAIIYSEFIKEYPNIYQSDSKLFVKMIEDYSPLITKDALLSLKNSSASGRIAIEKYLESKFGEHQIVAIHLVPFSYQSNKLDSTDIIIEANCDGYIKSTNLSLKAIKKRKSWITLKNPGAGTILGTTYFGAVNDMNDLTQKLKTLLINGEINHKIALEEISGYLGETLSKLSQENLKYGVEALLGKATSVITFYSSGESKCYDHNEIQSNIDVFKKTPKPSVTLLKWNNDAESIKLRVKFSSGQSKGWSSIKLACEYFVE